HVVSAAADRFKIHCIGGSKLLGQRVGSIFHRCFVVAGDYVQSLLNTCLCCHIGSNLNLMEHLWTPWRNAYVTQNKPGENKGLFAAIAQSSDDEKNFVLLRSKLCFALLN